MEFNSDWRGRGAPRDPRWARSPAESGPPDAPDLREFLVPPEWIEHSTSPLPRARSTTELRRRKARTINQGRAPVQAMPATGCRGDRARFATYAAWPAALAPGSGAMNSSMLAPRSVA